MPGTRYRVVPMELKDANYLVETLHRHHKPVQGHRFSIGALCVETGVIVGAAIVGRPVARMTNQRATLEITRLVTDGSEHAPSFLYGAVVRVARALGYTKVQTFILDSEPGTSLRAAGYVLEQLSGGGSWERLSKPNRRHDQPEGPKQRWAWTAPTRKEGT